MGEVETTGGVCLNGGKSGPMAFQTRTDRHNQAIGWLRKGLWRWNGGTISTVLEVIWGMSVNTVQLRRCQPELITHRMPSLIKDIIIGGNAELKINGS